MSYEIADEPSPSGDLGKLVFQPNAPLLAAMMCGAWLAWPWFILNSIAMGSPTRQREIKLSLLAVGGTVALGMLVFGLVDAGIIESALALRIALLGITCWKLGMAYLVSTVQSRTFHVYRYYGGAVQNAGYVLFAGMQLSGFVVDASENPLWHIIVSGLM
jgi:hypothetical protein